MIERIIENTFQIYIIHNNKQIVESQRWSWKEGLKECRERELVSDKWTTAKSGWGGGKSRRRPKERQKVTVFHNALSGLLLIRCLAS